MRSLSEPSGTGEARPFAAEISQALMFDAHRQITELEAEIDQLQEDIARCRKISLVAKTVFIGGCATVLFGFLADSPLAVVVAIGTVLGALALMGSNNRTQDEIVAALNEHEARRSATIDGIQMKMLSSLSSEGVRKH
jgi:type III secretory pathway component EscV